MNIGKTAFVETLTMFMAIAWQPFFGIIMSACGIMYYLAITKQRVVNRYYNGSWWKFIKSIFL